MRVRPPALNLAEADNSKCLEVDSENNLLRMHSKPDAKVFTFDQVADENTTQVSHHGDRIRLFNVLHNL